MCAKQRERENYALILSVFWCFEHGGLYICVYFIPGHERMILKKCQDDPWTVWWGGKQQQVGVLDLEARRPAGWTGNSDTGTCPYETAPNSAPRGISEQKERKI